MIKERMREGAGMKGVCAEPGEQQSQEARKRLANVNVRAIASGSLAFGKVRVLPSCRDREPILPELMFRGMLTGPCERHSQW